MLLAGDIGGTKTHLALFERDKRGLVRRREALFRSADYATFDAVVEAFLATEPASVEAACFGIAGPVGNGFADTTNLPWRRIEAESLRGLIGCSLVHLLNDLEAAALGMLHLSPAEMIDLNPAAEPAGPGNIAVLAAGTGLGEAILHWDGQRHRAIATEGGHSDFAPNDPQQDDLLVFLRGRCGGHVSYERLLSGEGLYNIYQFLKGSGFAPVAVDPAEQGGDPSAAISRLALEGCDPVCEEALRLFCRIYGAEAGNLALKCLSRGGVFIGGGIAPKILPAIQKGDFMAGFLDKGRFGPLLKKMPVKVVLNADTPLLGAAHHAAESA